MFKCIVINIILPSLLLTILTLIFMYNKKIKLNIKKLITRSRSITFNDIKNNLFIAIKNHCGYFFFIFYNKIKKIIFNRIVNYKNIITNTKKYKNIIKFLEKKIIYKKLKSYFNSWIEDINKYSWETILIVIFWILLNFYNYHIKRPYILIIPLELCINNIIYIIYTTIYVISEIIYTFQQNYLIEFYCNIRYYIITNAIILFKNNFYISLIFLNISKILSYWATFIITTLLYILIGGVIPLLERKYLSLIQRRIGPKYVGYNGRLQFIADAVKLLLKELIILKRTNVFLFCILPIFILFLNLLPCIFIVWFNVVVIINNDYLLFIILIIEIITLITTTYIGLLVNNKYTTIASIRLINMSIITEIFIILIFLYIYIIYNITTWGYINWLSIYFNKIIYSCVNIGFFIYFILILIKKPPFDVIEAETELIMGYSIEHSGFLNGALLLIEYLHLFFWLYIYILIFII